MQREHLDRVLRDIELRNTKNESDLDRLLEAADESSWTERVWDGSFAAVKRLIEQLLAIEGMDPDDHAPTTGRIRNALSNALGRIVHGGHHSVEYLWLADTDQLVVLPGWERVMWSDGREQEIPIVRQPRLYEPMRLVRDQGKEHDEALRTLRTEDPCTAIQVEVPTHQNSDTQRQLTLDRIKALSKYMMDRQWQFVGVKAKTNSRPLAVFAKGATWERAIINLVGPGLASIIRARDDMKHVQNLVTLFTRQGHKPKVPDGFRIDFSHSKNMDDRMDGVVASFDEHTSNIIRALCPFLTSDTKVFTGTLLMDEVLSKGTFWLDRPTNVFYTATAKVGNCPQYLDMSRILIASTDSAQRAGHSRKIEKLRLEGRASHHELKSLKGGINTQIIDNTSLNLSQEIPYNYDKTEREVLFNELFKPEIIRASTGKDRLPTSRRIEALVTLDITPSDDEETRKRIKHQMQKWVMQTAQKVPIPSYYLLFMPDPNLDAFTIRVPKRTKYKKGDKICVTRYPSLPLGNSTQIYTIVGFTDGNYCEVSADPWMTIQGGDFDGDCGRISRKLYEIFPDKEYDKTRMSELSIKKSQINNISDINERFKQADRVMNTPIGIYDMLARCFLDAYGTLPSEVRMACARAIQAAISSQKHLVEIEEPAIEVPDKDGNMQKVAIKDLIAFRDSEGNPILYPSQIARQLYHIDRYLSIDFQRQECRLTKEEILENVSGSIYDKIIRLAFNKAEKIELPTRDYDVNALQAEAKALPIRMLAPEEHYKTLMQHGWKLAQWVQDQFIHLRVNRAPDGELSHLADMAVITMEVMANKFAIANVKQMTGSAAQQSSLIRSLVREARRVQERCIVAKVNRHMLTRMFPIDTLRLLLNPGLPM